MFWKSYFNFISALTLYNVIQSTYWEVQQPSLAIHSSIINLYTEIRFNNIINVCLNLKQN